MGELIIKVKKEEFLTNLNYLKFVISKSNLPILNNVLLETNSNTMLLRGTNLDLELNLNCKLIEPISEKVKIVVPLREIIDTLRTISDNTIVLKINETEIIVNNSGKISLDISWKDFPIPIKENKKDESIISTIVFEKRFFKEMIEKSRSKTETRKSSVRETLKSILFQQTSKDSMKFIATDGRILSHFTKTGLTIHTNDPNTYFFITVDTLDAISNCLKFESDFKSFKKIKNKNSSSNNMLSKSDIVMNIYDSYFEIFDSSNSYYGRLDYDKYIEYDKFIDNSYTTTLKIGADTLSKKLSEIKYVVKDIALQKIDFSISTNKIVLSAEDNLRNLQRSVVFSPISYKSNSDTIDRSFDLCYLEDICNTFSNEKLVIKMTDDEKEPIMIYAEGKDTFHILLMGIS